MPHDGWRELLPYLIDTYKNGRAYVNEEKVVTWYRPSLAKDCSDGKTSGNTASQLQLEFDPADLSEDRVYFTALLQETANVAVYFDGGIRVKAEWDFLPPGPEGFGGAGLYHGSVPAQHAVNLEVHITRDTMTIFSVVGNKSISAENCVDGLTNWNAWVGVNPGEGKVPAVWAAFGLEHLSCVAGYSVDDFNDLCEFTCAWGYCPVGACVCSNLGILMELPPTNNSKVGYPANGDANYAGLCNFACGHGYCPGKWCAETVQDAYIPASSPFDPPTCTKGSGEGNLAGLCSYAYSFGFCPKEHCSCTSTGPLIQPPAQVNSKGISLVGSDSDLCNFACTRGYCPDGVCAQINPVWADNSCDAGRKATILAEMGAAIQMASQTRDNLQKGQYYKRFFASGLREDPKFAGYASGVFRRVAELLSGTDAYKFTISCNNEVEMCTPKKKNKPGFIAYMNDKDRHMNFCDRFFTMQELSLSSQNLENCNVLSLRSAHRSQATIIFHEATHTSYAIGEGFSDLRTGPSQDYAYGISDCLRLAQGTFDRSCTAYKNTYKHLCLDKNGKMGIWPPETSGDNADSYTLVAAGVYYSLACGRDIPVPQITASTTEKCPVIDDPPLIFDGGDLAVIDGYVHLGDSYAAGMGTGSTSGGSCRVGSNNYGKLLYEWFDDSTIPMENKACSGDTLTGLARQIKEWRNPKGTSLGTLTIGGNDIGFERLVRSCVLTPNNNILAHNRGNCEKYEAAARAMLEDTSSSGLRYKLKEAYKSVVVATGRSVSSLTCKKRSLRKK